MAKSGKQRAADYRRAHRAELVKTERDRKAKDYILNKVSAL